ncbi:MAG: glycosyltransferase [Anaerolineae bacterium]|nr:glycosyltransferase [Anaerolineae bacterium]
MSVFNAERYLKQAIESILKQTFDDFELLILNDGSTDSSAGIVATYAQQDNRIIVHLSPTNQGLVKNLVFGVTQARGKYIARMDADDISLPQRLEKQVAYLDARPEVGLLGTNVQYIDENGAFLEGGRSRHLAPESEVVLRWMLMWKNVIYHPTVMLRRRVLEEHHLNYNAEYSRTQDWELWTQMIRHTQVHRLHDVLLHYRILPASLSHTAESKIWIRRNMEREMIAFMGNAVVSHEGFSTLLDVFSQAEPQGEQVYWAATALLFEIYRRYRTKGLSPTDRRTIETDVINRCRTLARLAARGSRREALQILMPAIQLNAGLFMRIAAGKLAARVNRQ